MINFKKHVFTPEELEQELEKKFNEYSFMKNFVTIHDPLKNKPTSRTLYKSKGAYWVHYNKCKCFITEGCRTTMINTDDNREFVFSTFYIGY